MTIEKEPVSKIYLELSKAFKARSEIVASLGNYETSKVGGTLQGEIKSKSGDKTLFYACNVMITDSKKNKKEFVEIIRNYWDKDNQENK